MNSAASQPQSRERRLDPRLINSIPLKIKSASGDGFVTETVNISRSGAYCRVNSFIEPMTKIKLNFLIPSRRGAGKKISCSGVVVRTEPSRQDNHYNVAIFFNDISVRDAALISEYIMDIMDRSSSGEIDPALN
jgi:hypothetical protein